MTTTEIDRCYRVLDHTLKVVRRLSNADIDRDGQKICRHLLDVMERVVHTDPDIKLEEDV